MKSVTKVPHLIHGGDYNPDQWLNYPEVLSEDIRLMKLAGVNSATLAVFAWSELEPEEGHYHFEWLDEVIDRLYQNGIHTVLATPSGARPVWMDKKYPDICRVDNMGVLHTHGRRHNHCYTSPTFREKVSEINTRLAERYAYHPGLILWHVSNEYSGACWCPRCQAAFRSWLRNRYDDNIDKLNDEWWTGFWSRKYSDFEEIDAPSPNGESLLHGLNLDWKRFQTAMTKDFLECEIKPLRTENPDIPITTNFHGNLLDLNYWKLSKSLDVTSWDVYPIWDEDKVTKVETAAWAGLRYDICRSLGRGKPFLLMESAPSVTNCMPVCKLKRPGVHMLSEIQAVAHGADSVQYFQWRNSRGGSEKFHRGVVDHEGTENTRVFREVQDLGKTLSKLDCLVGTEVHAKTALIFDWENGWAVQDFQGLRSDKDYARIVTQHYKSLFHLGIPVDVVDETANFSKYQFVIAPMMYLLREGIQEKLERFVHTGGTLVTTYATGYVNEEDQCFLGGFPEKRLRKILGIWAEEIDALYDSDRNFLNWENPAYSSDNIEIKKYCELLHSEGAEVLATYREDFYKGMPAITKNYFGDGKAFHIGCQIDTESLISFYSVVAAEAGIDTPGERLPKSVIVRERESDNNRYLFFMNFSEQEEHFTIPKGTDLVTGSVVDGDIRLRPFGISIIEIQK